MNEINKEKFSQFAKEQSPNEACALLIIEKGLETLVLCKNVALFKQRSFIIDPIDYSFAEERGEIIAIIHSHPNKLPTPSEPDLVECEKHGVTWHIYSVSTTLWHEFKPSGYKASLLGREFHYGVLDCYSLVRDYYKENLGIELFDLERTDEEAFKKGHSLYEQHMKDAGFSLVDKIEVNDVLIMQIGFRVPCHAAIYIGNNQIMHHLRGHLSSRDVYGEFYRKRTRMICRYNK